MYLNQVNLIYIILVDYYGILNYDLIINMKEFCLIHLKEPIRTEKLNVINRCFDFRLGMKVVYILFMFLANVATILITLNIFVGEQVIRTSFLVQNLRLNTFHELKRYFKPEKVDHTEFLIFNCFFVITSTNYQWLPLVHVMYETMCEV